MYPTPQEPELVPPNADNTQGVIARLVVLCNNSIKTAHIASLTDANISDELIDFMACFDELYLDTSAWILHEKPGLEVPVGDKKIRFSELCRDFEAWLTQTAYEPEDPPEKIMGDGAAIFRAYLQALIIMSLYNPKLL